MISKVKKDFIFTINAMIPLIDYEYIGRLIPLSFSVLCNLTANNMTL
jgi:hypothetical protein